MTITLSSRRRDCEHRRSHIAASGVSVGKRKREREEGKRCGRQRNSERKRRIRVRGIRVYCETKPISLSLSLSLSRPTKEDKQATLGHKSCDFSRELRKEKLLQFLWFPWRRIRQPGTTVVLCTREGGKEGRM
jgi:hypothetical protein